MKSSKLWSANRVLMSALLVIPTLLNSSHLAMCKLQNTADAAYGKKPPVVSSFGDNQWTPMRDYKSQESLANNETSNSSSNNKTETMKVSESQLHRQSASQEANLRAISNYAEPSEDRDGEQESAIPESSHGRDSAAPKQSARRQHQQPRAEVVEEAESDPEADQEPDQEPEQEQQVPESEAQARKEQEAAEASEAEAADRSALDEQQQAQREIILAQAQSEARAIKEQQESLLRQTQLQQQMLLRRNHELESNHSDMRQQGRPRKAERRQYRPSQSRKVAQVQKHPSRHEQQQQYSSRPHQQSDIQFSDQPDRTNPSDKNAINQEDEMSEYSERQPMHSQPEESATKKSSGDLLPAAQHHYGSHYGTLHGHHKDYYMYAESHKKGQFDSGYKRGGKKFLISGHSSQHKSHAEGHVKWKGKKGKGTHYWGYKHKDKKGHHHHHY